MVSVRLNLFAVHPTEQFLTSWSQVLPFARNFLCRAAQSLVHKQDSRSFAITEMKRFSEGLKNNFGESLYDTCAEFVWYFLLFSLRVVPRKLKTVTTCSRFIRALVAACPGSNMVLVYLGNTFVQGKSLFLSLFSYF